MPDPNRTAESAPEVADRAAAGLAKLALVFRHQAWQAGDDHGLPPTQAQILAIVAGRADAEEPPAGLGIIADQLAVTAGTASAAVSALVEKKLLRKTRSRDDGRAIVLKLTAAGRRLAPRAAAWPPSILHSIASLPGRDQAGLVRALTGMIRDLQTRGDVPTARMCVECRYFRPNEYPESDRPHHCVFLKSPIRDVDLQLDCHDMEPAGSDDQTKLWQVFVEGHPLDSNGTTRPLPSRSELTERN